MLSTLTKVNHGSVLGPIGRGGYGICTALLLLGSVAQSVWADSLSFSETLADKLISHREEGGTTYEIVQTGTFNLRGTMTWQQLAAITNIDANTEFSIEFGSFTFAGVLGNDPKFKAGRRSASFVMGHENDSGKFVKDYTVSVRWNKTTFSAAVSGRLSGAQGSVVADRFTGNTGVSTDATDLTVNFAGLQLVHSVNLTANTTHKTITKGRGDAAEEFELTKVTVRRNPAVQ